MKNLRTDFGAVGDGVADDTAALQRAVNTQGNTIFVPSGTYNVTSQLDVAGSGCQLEGEFGATTIVYQGPTNTQTVFGFGGTVAQGDFGLRNVRVTCGTPGSTGYALAASGSAALSGFLFERCKFDGFFLSALRAAATMDRVSLLDCEMTDNSRFPGSALSAGCVTGTLTNSRIQGCWVHDTGVLSTLNHGIYLNGGSQNIIATGNTFDACGSDAFNFGTSTDGLSGRPENTGLTFANNIIRHVPDAALRVANATAVSCVGNVVTDSAYCAVVGPLAYGWLVADNVCASRASPATASGVCICLAVYGAGNGTVRGNAAVYTAGFDNYFTATGWGVMVNGCDDIDVADNTITGYDIGVNIVANYGAGVVNRRLRVRDNSIVRPAGSAEPQGPFRPFGGYTTGISVEGGNTDIELAGNRIVNYATGILLSNRGNVVPGASAVACRGNRMVAVANPIQADSGFTSDITL